MDDFNFNVKYDFSKLSAVEISKLKVNFADLRYITENQFSAWRPILGFPTADYFYFVIGCNSKSQFFELALNYNPDNETFIFSQIQIADETDIRKYYCG